MIKEKSKEINNEHSETETLLSQGKIVKKNILGTIINCFAVNIRKEPNTNSEVLFTVKAGNDVILNDEKPENGWYNITEKYGFTGYVMADYVEIKEDE